ncbi:MAG: T9SS type A sorting domain-containing protein [Bacteroidetes bacterium]|nr:T9SS type A sorting domain-containing protein [Bacteroidota bacterium]
MKQTLLILLSCMLGYFSASAQFQGEPFSIDSVYFTAADTVPHQIVADTAAAPLWQIGNTTKAVFSTGAMAAHGIMTDTTHHYPVSANNWFTLIIPVAPPNMILDIWHEYQTDSAKDGGIVEFSSDSGATWLNIAYCRNPFPGLITQNFYSYADSLPTGEQAFSGNSGGQVHSRLQFFDCVMVKKTATSCDLTYTVRRPLYIRFRFSSDTLADTLSGWKIDSLKILGATCPGYVTDVSGTLQVAPYPNPAHDGIFNFPALERENDLSLDVYNMLGAKVYSGKYIHQLNLSNYAPGLYFFTLHNPRQQYSGKLNYL